MNISSMIWLVVATTGVGGVVGALLGWLMGTYLPDFYIATVQGPGNPLHIALGFGIAQGIIMGFVLGLVIVLVRAFLLSKRGDPPVRD